ncbi:MAG: hypothetical protein RLY31_2192 [Bacteroidota bacterium]
MVGGIFSLLLSQPCDCLTTGNCPVSIEDNNTFYGTLDVTVSGANDLGQCPLTQLCFTINHTWIGDLSVALISPGGLNYLVMADANNGFGGCGNQEDNVEICINTGTGSPVTNNTEYICNTGPCTAGTCCLTGNYTMPCGGVTDPINGAQQAPNCDLNDFNLPGQPANGTWTLVINDVCPNDVGNLQNFSLIFDCGTSSCVVCEADGGMLPPGNIASCFGDPSLVLSLPPQYSGPPPPASEYGYVYVVSQNGIITGLSPNADLTFQPPGTYEVCGLSYQQSALGNVQSLIGSSLALMQAQLGSATSPFCADFSDNCISVTIGPAIVPTFLDTLVCLGDCIEIGGQTLCNSGSVTLTSWLGCDSVVNVLMIPVLPSYEEDTLTVCENECVILGGQLYCPPGPHVVTLTNSSGCDSTITLYFEEVPTSAVVSPANPPPISCANPSVTLSAIGSMPPPGPNVSYVWQGPALYSTSQVITVSTAGTYTLAITNNQVDPPCLATATINITGAAVAPQLQLNSPPPTICQGEFADLSQLNIIDLNNTDPLLTYHTGSPATAANQIGSIVVPDTTTTYYILGTTGVCSDELAVTVMVQPIPSASFSLDGPICVDSFATVSYTGSSVAGATFSWNFGGGTAVPGTGEGPHQVSWATGGNKTITLFIAEGGCTSLPVSQNIQVNNPIPAPVLNCQPQTSTVTFTWTQVVGAAGYQVVELTGPPGVALNDTTWQVTGLDPGQQVTILVEAISNNACPGSSAQLTCTAQDCPPITVGIGPVDPICRYDTIQPVQLSATQTGGTGGGAFTWQGPGVNPLTGLFNPLNANNGPNTILLTYEEGNCVYNGSRVIQVNTPPAATFSVQSPVCEADPSVINYTGDASADGLFHWDFGGGMATPGTGAGPHVVEWPGQGMYTVTLVVEENGCSSDTGLADVTVETVVPVAMVQCDATTETITFFWPSVPGADGYEFTVPGGQVPSVSTDTSATFTGLSPGDAITIQVSVLQDGVCPNSTSLVTCIAQDCPPVTLEAVPMDTICLTSATQPVQLTVTLQDTTGGGSLSWSGPGITDTLIGQFDPVTAGPGVHSVLATYMEGNCTFTVGMSIFVFSTPTASFSMADSVCAGSGTTLTYTGTLQGGLEFTWVFGSGQAVPGTGQGPHTVVWPAGGAELVELTVSSPQGCLSQPYVDTVHVADTLEAPVIACQAGTGAIQFSWDPVAGAADYEVSVLTGQSGQPSGPTGYQVTGLTAGETVGIAVTASGAGSCPPVTGTATCIALDCPPVQLDLLPVPPYCLEINVPLSLTASVNGGTGGGTGSWSGPGVIDGANGVFDPTTAGIGQHLLTYTYTEGNCTYSDTMSIFGYPVPTADFSMPAAACATEAVTVSYTGTGGAGTEFNWNFDGGNADPGIGVGPHQVSWTDPGTYQVVLEILQNGCFAEQVGTIVLDTPLVAPLISCVTTQESIAFGWAPVPGASEYEVNVLTGQSGQQQGDTGYLLTGLQPGETVTLVLQVSAAGACAPVMVQQTCEAVGCPPVSVTLPAAGPFCQTAADMPVAMPVVLSGQVSAGTAQWSGTGITDAEAGLFDAAVAGAGDHVLTYTYEENNCIFTETTTVTVVAPPGADAGEDVTLTCKEGETEARLGGSGTAVGANITYAWSSLAGDFPGAGGEPEPLVSEAGTYVLTVSDTVLGCSTTDTVSVESSQEIPVPEVVIRPVSCYGKEDGFLTVTAVDGGEAPYLYALNGGAYSSEAEFGPLAPGEYVVSVMDAAGCEQSLTIDITQPQALDVELVVYVEGDGVIRLGDSVQLAAQTNVPTDSLDLIDWEPDSLLSCDGCPAPFAHPLQTTTFTVTVEANGCSDSDQRTLFVRREIPLYLPNAFSPNGDGINDIFMVQAGGQVDRIRSFLIFDRWGETVFQYFDFPPNDPDYGWTGEYRGRVVNMDVYTWFVEVLFPDGTSEILEGDVTVIR